MINLSIGIWTLNHSGVTGLKWWIPLELLSAKRKINNEMLWDYPIHILQKSGDNVKNAIDLMRIISIAKSHLGQPLEPEVDSKTVAYILAHPKP